MRLLSALWIATLWSCATVNDIPIDPKAIPSLGGKEMVVVRRAIADFTAVTPNTMSVGIVPIVGFAAKDKLLTVAGNLLVEEHRLEDPAYEIADEIAAIMEVKYGTKRTSNRNVQTGGDDDISVLSAAYQSVPLALDVKTIAWGLSYTIITSDQYHVFLRVRLRLVNTDARKALVQAQCHYRTTRDETTTYDELVKNNALHLKEELQKGVRFCVRDFSSKYLGM